MTDPSPPSSNAPSRRALLGGLAAAGAAAAGVGAWQTLRSRPPNVIVILTDDQGYNDLGCYYTPPKAARAYGAIRTPRLDRMADEGLRLTNFYVAASVCTPSRAALMTGCYPPRVGFGAKDLGLGVLTPASKAGLNPSETTLAEMFREAGYTTGCVGKWHLGHHEPFQPLSQGFDTFFGIPWSANQKPLPLVLDRETLRRLPGRPVLVRQFTEAAINFVRQNQRDPFFLYLAYSAPHEPWAVLPSFRGRSERGLYGDVIEMVDHFVGELLDALDHLGLSEDTLVVFTSDNGPWLEPPRGGSAHPLRGGKATVWEGGFRSPCLWRWPGVLPEGQVVDEVVTALDLLPTFAGLAGVPDPEPGRFREGDRRTRRLARAGAGRPQPHRRLLLLLAGSPGSRPARPLQAGVRQPCAAPSHRARDVRSTGRSPRDGGRPTPTRRLRHRHRPTGRGHARTSGGCDSRSARLGDSPRGAHLSRAVSRA
ncbi:MAG: sulfatase-like hydrolase/transferase [Myxococcales bacterium]|nr:sulfatase-like hydrolase/transferase [Myxococcales bacterium]